MLNRILLSFLVVFISITGFSQADTSRVEDPDEMIPIREVFNGEGDVAPEFQGGDQKMIKWIVAKIKYPEAAIKDSIQGKVYVQFVVEKDGSLTQAKILRSPSDLLSEEVMRLVAIMPKWNPGRMMGEPVRALYTLPVNFSL